MSVARYFQAIVAYGDRVYVFDGVKEPEDYGSPVPPFDVPDPDYTTVPTTIPESTLPNVVVTTIAGSPTTIPVTAP